MKRKILFAVALFCVIAIVLVVIDDKDPVIVNDNASVYTVHTIEPTDSFIGLVSRLEVTIEGEITGEAEIRISEIPSTRAVVTGKFHEWHGIDTGNGQFHLHFRPLSSGVSGHYTITIKRY